MHTHYNHWQKTVLVVMYINMSCFRLSGDPDITCTYLHVVVVFPYLIQLYRHNKWWTKLKFPSVFPVVRNVTDNKTMLLKWRLYRDLKHYWRHFIFVIYGHKYKLYIYALCSTFDILTHIYSIMGDVHVSVGIIGVFLEDSLHLFYVENWS